jgi:DNA (cytosine-5)-methyltransferase 1
VELFAGVGGFRIGLERSGWRVVWSNQWEPATRAQHASDCYVRHFGTDGHVCQDIHVVMDEAEAGLRELPDHDLLVGGFPCQDYSVARTLDQALGLEGRKGVLWWQIHRLLTMKRPPFIFLENVDRLLKSPADQRGRDFAVMAATLGNLGYEIEWRAVNAADYGFPQKRRRLLIVGRLAKGKARRPEEALYGGVLARALPASGPVLSRGWDNFAITGDPADLSETFGSRHGLTRFRSAGFVSQRQVWTADVIPAYDGPHSTLADVLEPTADVSDRFFIPEARLGEWRYLKGSKREPRVHKATGTPYFYAEGPLPFPDRTDRPSRTILTGEGGATPSRFKHVIQVDDGRYRRLTPRELERLNGFPDDWTDTGMPEGRRAFMMGNALVVGLIERVGRELIQEVGVPEHREPVKVAA